MFGLRSQYALSNILIANLRQQMHFAYLQDDFRVNDKLTLNLGLRYEYATPHWEKDNILSNYDPDARTDDASRRTARSRIARSIKPDRNNFGPRLGFAWSVTPATVVRGGYGISYVHFHRAGAANILPINGPQVINAVANQTDPTTPSFRTTQQGYPARFADPSAFNPLAGEHHLHARGLPLEPGAELLHLGPARDRAQHDRRRRLRRQPRRRPAAVRELQPGGAEQCRRARSRSQARRPIPEFADITYAFNGGKSRYNACR